MKPDPIGLIASKDFIEWEVVFQEMSRHRGFGSCELFHL